MRGVGGWAHLMSSTVTVAPRTGQDTYGKPTYGAASSYRGHIAKVRAMVRTAGGEDVESGQAIYLDTTDAIQPSAQLTLSTADVGSTEAAAIHPLIVAVARRNDQGGPHHVVLYLGGAGWDGA